MLATGTTPTTSMVRLWSFLFAMQFLACSADDFGGGGCGGAWELGADSEEVFEVSLLQMQLTLQSNNSSQSNSSLPMQVLTPTIINAFSKAKEAVLNAFTKEGVTFWPFCILAFVTLVWLIEYKCRARFREMVCKHDWFRQLAPEISGLTLVVGLVILLLSYRKDHSLDGDAVWTEVKHDWPLLTTADSLLGIQALIRLVFLVSASFRRGGALSSPFAEEPAAFFLFACGTRVALLILSPADAYRLDGPLGGDMNMAAEVTAFLLLVPLGYQVLLKGMRHLACVFVAILLCLGLACTNHFALAGAHMNHLDVLFSFIVLLEVLAAVSFLIRSGYMGSGHTKVAFAGFAHFLLPFQQAMPTYFLLVAFAPPFQAEPSLVGNGRPFELLQAAGLAQVLMYIFAWMLFCMACAAEEKLSVFAMPVLACEAPEADECVICLGSCEDRCCAKPQWRRLNCGHHFHEHCILEWLRKAHRCPTCRRHIREKGKCDWKQWQPPQEDADIPMENSDERILMAIADDMTESEEGVPLLADEEGVPLLP
jgi:hypothetical protein